MQKIINELITFSIKGADVYRWKNATWLIFTNDTRWVVELTDGGTLWYNYRFFNDVFNYISMECGQQTEEYIIRWANDFFYKDCAHRTVPYPIDKARNETPKVLDNGVKNLSGTRTLGENYVEMVVQRGKNHGDEFEWHTRAVINKGVKEVNQSDSIHRQRRAENEMSRMVKEVKPNRVTVVNEKMDRFYYDPNCTANFTILTDIVEEGVKEAMPNIIVDGGNQTLYVYDYRCKANNINIKDIVKEGDVTSIIKNGIKNIYPDKIPDDYDWSDEFKPDTVIECGVKLIPLPDQSGELRGYSDYYSTKEDRTKPHTEYVKEAIEGGMKVIPLPDMRKGGQGYSAYYDTNGWNGKPHTEYVKEAVNGGVKL